MNPLIQLKQTTAVFLGAFGLACFALSPTARAVSPPPDGGYPGGNTAEGNAALRDLTTGEFNTAVGASALRNNTSGNQNTAVGADALRFNTTGSFNTANGAEALQFNTTGFDNTANGSGALLNNTAGTDNTATGVSALGINTTGPGNTATGSSALEFNTTGAINTANGFDALLNNTTGSDNTAIGAGALQLNTTGIDNTATGVDALEFNTTGHKNTANGVGALQENTTGHDNLAEGYAALDNNTTGSSNIAVGNQAGANLTTGSNNIDIAAPGVAGDANTIRIGKSGTQTKTFIAGIHGATVANGVGVIVGTTGQLGTVVSSARFKEVIKPMDKASEAILALKPVSFRYKKEVDPQRVAQFGLVAEDVEKINPDLVIRDAQGRPQTVRYEQVNAMLLNEFLKEHKTVQEQGATIARLEKQIEALTAGLQKVSAQLELSKTAPQTVLNNQ
jgi:Chaperone of endosialidase